jgi:membrane fusion protein (multidrug efflux system)
MNYFKSISVILISTLIIAGCSSKQTSDTSGGANVVTDMVPVKVMGLTKTKIARTIDYSATALPYEEVNMAPSTPGRIDKIYVEVGDKVNMGDNLFLMDRTQLYQLELQLSSLEKDLNRIDTLLKAGSAKQQQYDQMKTQFDVTRTNVDFMKENTLLKAPFSGVITGKYFENGELYSGAPTTSTGRAAVITIMQLNPLKINVGVSEQYYPLIRKNMVASITADVYENETFTGKVSRIYPTINSSTRSFIVEIEVPNNKDILKPGMFVRVSMDLGEVETFVVPANTVLVQEGTNTRYVFISENGEAKRIDVILGKRFDDKFEILSDNIKEGDLLVVEGQAKLITGDKLEIIK